MGAVAEGLAHAGTAPLQKELEDFEGCEHLRAEKQCSSAPSAQREVGGRCHGAWRAARGRECGLRGGGSREVWRVRCGGAVVAYFCVVVWCQAVLTQNPLVRVVGDLKNSGLVK